MGRSSLPVPRGASDVLARALHRAAPHQLPVWMVPLNLEEELQQMIGTICSVFECCYPLASGAIEFPSRHLPQTAAELSRIIRQIRSCGGVIGTLTDTSNKSTLSQLRHAVSTANQELSQQHIWSTIHLYSAESLIGAIRAYFPTS